LGLRDFGFRTQRFELADPETFIGCTNAKAPSNSEISTKFLALTPFPAKPYSDGSAI
jgi:hypothetical protein